MITKEILEQRRGYIGGSDVPIIMGLSTYKTAYQLYLEKCNLIDIDYSETQQQYWGNVLEGVIRDEFCKKNGVKVEMLPTIEHPVHSFIRGNVDGFIPEYNAVLEIKTSSGFAANQWGDPDSDQIPLPYLLQCATYIALTNADYAVIAVLIGGNDYREYVYHRNLKIEERIIKACIKFWESVQNRTPPDPVNIDDLRLMFPTAIQNKTVTIEDYNTFDELVSHRMKSKVDDEYEQELKFKLMKFMGDAEILLDADGDHLATWKTNKAGKRTFLVKMMRDK